VVENVFFHYHEMTRDDWLEVYYQLSQIEKSGTPVCWLLISRKFEQMLEEGDLSQEEKTKIKEHAFRDR
jgi:hypothetical protein